ncbi:DUF6541 family protein [Microbacterium sp. NPDC089695]|uniref:DUF6541 family protein n=1 Tax=Microbacterium sp. NPDC089695 TaxID=3364198 RepID=UPI00380A69BE
MILDWLGAVPAFAVAVLIVFGPGLLALAGVGLRGLALVAYAPLFSIAATAIAALAFGAVGVAWTPLAWCGAMVVLIALAWIVGRVTRVESVRESFPLRSVLVVGLALGIAFGVWRIVSYIGDPAGISQTNDAIFHMNALRYILETQDASSLHVNAVIGGRSFYPAAWHGIASLVAIASGAGIPVAANVLSVVIGAVIWPLGLAWLARTVFRSNVIAAYAAVLASALQAFPLLMFQWGVLFPNALSTAILPAGITAVIVFTRRLADSRAWQDAVRLALFTAVTVAAILLAQPAAILAWGAICAVWLTFFAFSARSGLSRVWAAVTSAVLWIALALSWVYLSSGTSGSHWPAFRGKLEVLVDVLLNGQVRIPVAVGVSALMIVGLVIAVRRVELRWFAVAWLGISGLYVLVAAIGNPWVRETILGAWYADPYRITALAPLVVIPLAALGLDVLVRLGARVLGRDGDSAAVSATGLVLAAVGMVVLILLRGVAMPAFLEGTYDRESRYTAAADSDLNPDERALLEALPGLVEADARVLGNPSTGAAFGYFLSGIDVYPRTWSPPKTEPWEVISEQLRDAATEPAVCEALEIYGDPEYVLDFGPSDVGSGKFPAPGMTGFASKPGFELVAEDGAASLWRITACAR